MRKAFLSILILVSFVAANAQDTVTVKHHCYTSTFVQSEHIPVLVEYTLTAQMVDCKDHLPRATFKADPALNGTNLAKDYKGGGYDCGHNMSAEDNSCNQTGENECFYYTNMFPQTAKLNRGVWKALENEERSMAKQYGAIEVFVGNDGIYANIGPDKVVVPKYCWKVIYVPKTGKYSCYLFPNNNTVTGAPEDYVTNDVAPFKNVINHFSTKYKL